MPSRDHGPVRAPSTPRGDRLLRPSDRSASRRYGAADRPGQALDAAGPETPRLRSGRGRDRAVAAGGFAALGVQSLVQGRAPAASTAPSTEPSDDTGEPGDTGDTGDVPSDAPEDSVAPMSPVLEGRMPTSINGVALTVQSAVDATNLSSGPDGRALDAAVVRLGKQASDLEIALAEDDSGSLDLTIFGFRVDGVAAGDIRKAVLEAWLAAGTPGVVTSTVSLSGIDVTKVSYGDGGTDEYVLTIERQRLLPTETSDVTIGHRAAASAIIAPPNASPSAGSSPGS